VARNSKNIVIIILNNTDTLAFVTKAHRIFMWGTLSPQIWFG